MKKIIQVKKLQNYLVVITIGNKYFLSWKKNMPKY